MIWDAMYYFLSGLAKFAIIFMKQSSLKIFLKNFLREEFLNFNYLK